MSVCRLMMAGPLLFIGAIAINARFGTPPDANKQFGPEVHRQLVRYVEPVRASRALNSMPQKERQAALDKVTALWISRSREEGELATVLSPDFQSLGQDSVLTDIKFARMTLIMALHDRAGRYEVLNDAAQEAKAQVSVFQVASIDKYSDFPTIHQFANLQAKALDRISVLAPRLTEAERDSIWAKIVAAKESGTSVREVVLHLRRIHADYLAQRSDSALIARVSQSYHALAMASDQTTPATMQSLRTVSVNSGDDEFIKIGSMGRLALASEKTYENAFQRAKLALQSVK